MMWRNRKKQISQTDLGNTFKQGDIVVERINPAVKMVVTSFAGGIYYCDALDHPNRKSLVYFERELKPLDDAQQKNMTVVRTKSLQA